MTAKPTDRLQEPSRLPTWLLGVAMLLAIVVASVWNGYMGYRSVMEQQYHLLEVHAQQGEERIASSLRSVNLMLSLIIDDLGSRSPTRDADASRLLKSTLRQLPELRSLLVTDAAGRVITSNDDRLIGFVAAEREYFKVHRDAPANDGFHVSKPFKTISGITATTVSRVVRNSRGHFNGVVVATLEASFFDKALMLFGGETGTQCLLMNLDGDILNLVPYSDSIGKNLQGEIAYTEHIASGKPSTRHLNVIKLEHTLKMLVFQNLQEAPLAVVASRDYDSVTADWRRSMYVHAAIFLALAATILLLLRLSVRNHRSLILSRRDLAEREIKLRTIIEAEPECVKQLAPDGTLLGMNRAGLDMIEADSEAQVIGTKVIELITPEYRQAFADLSEHVNRGESGTLEFEIVGLKGGRRWLETHAVPMRDNEGGIVGLLGVTRDITVQKNTLAELEHLVQTDELTKLASRRHFFAQAELELSRAKRYYAASPSVLMLDIDHFKRINDTYGHEAGDVVLRTLGELCRGTLRDVDIAGRLGGEEFAVMLPETGREAALAVAERLRQTIADVKVSLEGGFPIRFTASIGVASFTEEHPNLDTLLSQADKALYEAKKAGRNRVWMFDPDKE